MCRHSVHIAFSLHSFHSHFHSRHSRHPLSHPSRDQCSCELRCARPRPPPRPPRSALRRSAPLRSVPFRSAVSIVPGPLPRFFFLTRPRNPLPLRVNGVARRASFRLNVEQQAEPEPSMQMLYFFSGVATFSRRRTSAGGRGSIRRTVRVRIHSCPFQHPFIAVGGQPDTYIASFRLLFNTNTAG